MSRRPWAREEQGRALELYLRTPFGKIHNRNPQIINLALQLGRTANALALKMANFAALDPTIPQKGMRNFSKSDAEMWEEFFSAPSSFLSQINMNYAAKKFDGEYNQAENTSMNFDFELREGENVERLVKTRKNQGYFRKMLMVSYEGKCAITGIEEPTLLIASHIKPWKSDVEARLNPRNGILLNSLHDRAFDSGLITFDADFSLITSQSFNLPAMAQPFFADKKLKKPNRFAPDPSFLEYHRTYRFQDSPLSELN